MLTACSQNTCSISFKESKGVIKSMTQVDVTLWQDMILEDIPISIHSLYVNNNDNTKQ